MRTKTAFGLAVGFVLGSTCVESRAQESPPTVLVRRVVPANFHDPDFDPNKFEVLLTHSVNRAVKAEPDTSVSEILQKEFNISESWTPRVYRQLADHVLNLNGLQKDSDLKANQVLKLPDLPRTSEVYRDPRKRPPIVPKSSLWTSWDKRTKAFTGLPTVGSNVSRTSKREMQTRLVPVSELLTLNIAKGPFSPAQSSTPAYQVMQEAMKLTFADVSGAAPVEPFLKPAEAAFLRRFLARPASTRPLLVIFDDAYPSQADFLDTAAFVIQASREIRERFGLKDAAHGDSPDLLALERGYRNGTIFCDADCEYPKLKTHTAMIRESLKELTQADASKRIEVLYLPVNAAQLYSKQILGEIIRVSLLADSVVDGLALTQPGAPERDRPVPAYESIPAQVEAMLAAEALYVALLPFNGATMTSQTDRGIIDCVVNFFWLYSMATQRPHFLSMSWTAPNLRYPTLFRANGYGLWLAAAGNDPKINVQSALLQFAARSSDPGDVIAVENVASACRSSTLATTVPVYGFAFPGRISSDLCGTSFSTPRLAWFLAAYEAIKGQAVKPNTEAWNQWRAGKRQVLMRLQSPGQADEARYRVTPWQLLGEHAPHP